MTVYQPTAISVQQFDNELRCPGQGVYHLMCLLLAQDRRQPSGSLRPDRIDGIIQIFFEDHTVEKEKGVESLILGRCRHIPVDSQVRKERFDLPLPHLLGVFLSVKEVEEGPLPQKAALDALHIAVAVSGGIEYLLTWNFAHLANATIRNQIERKCRLKGYEPPIICTPEELLGE